jgi:hypothetical protein
MISTFANRIRQESWRILFNGKAMQCKPSRYQMLYFKQYFRKELFAE